MKRFTLRMAIALLGVFALLAASIAEAQWVLVARRAIGRVEQISQSQENDGASYDSAAVMLEAPADKVFAAVVRGLANAQGITVTKEDASQRLVQFTQWPADRGDQGQRARRRPHAPARFLGPQRDPAECRGAGVGKRPQGVPGNERRVLAGAAVSTQAALITRLRGAPTFRYLCGFVRPTILAGIEAAGGDRPGG